MDISVISELSFKLDLNDRKIQLLPAYDFRAKDGRPYGLEGWKINGMIAAKIINKANQQKNSLLIDYEHQTLESAKNGKPAPAAGWFNDLEWVEGLGLIAKSVEWTEKAISYIKKREYRYISPVISYDKKTGEITSLLMAALVNYPAIDGMKDVSQLITAKNLLNGDNLLTEEELAVCSMMGVCKDDFLATKKLNQSEQSIYLQKNSQGLTEVELSVCMQLGIETDDYIRTKTTIN